MTLGGRKEENVLCNYVKWCNKRLRRDITRVTEIDSCNQENLTRLCTCERARACVFVYLFAHAIKNSTKLRSSTSDVMKFSLTRRCFRNETSPLKMEITRLFNATVGRSLSSGARKGAQKEKETKLSAKRGRRETTFLLVAYVSRVKKNIVEHFTEKVQWGQLMLSFLFGHSMVSRVSQMPGGKKSSTMKIGEWSVLQ